MVGDDTKGNRLFHFVGKERLVAVYRLWIDVLIHLATEFFECAKDRLKDVGRVIGRFLREIGKPLGVLNQ